MEKDLSNKDLINTIFRTKQTVVCSSRGLNYFSRENQSFFRGQRRISKNDFQSVFDTGVLRKKKNKELQLLQVGVETESLLLVQMMCCEDSAHVTRTLLSVHIFWRLRSLCARAVGL